MKKKIIITSTIVTLIIAILSIITVLSRKTNSKLIKANSEILRAMNYAEVTDEATKINNCDYIQFSAYFTRDIDNDGNANKILGTCKNVNSTDRLYMDINVLTNGYLKNGKITINGENFTYNMSTAEDDILKYNYISEDVKTIELNNINAGTQKLISGDISADLKNNIKNYSKDNTITLTGIHVSNSGIETKIEKTINLTVDWYGTLNTDIYTYGNNVYYNYNNLENTTISFNFSVDELQQELLLKENISTLTIPSLNGVAPEKAECINENVESNYNADTQKLTIKKEAEINENGIIEKVLGNVNTYTVNVTYPQNAYDSLTEDTTVTVPIESYYIAYNNKNDEFESILQSNTAMGKINVVFRSNWDEDGYVYDFNVRLSNKEYNKKINSFVISKQQLLNAFENYDEVNNMEYIVEWSAIRGNNGNVRKMSMSETRMENIQNEDAVQYGDRFNKNVIDNYVTNIGIYFAESGDLIRK